MKEFGMINKQKQRLLLLLTAAVLLILSPFPALHASASQNDSLFRVHFLFDVYEVISYDFYADTHQLRISHRCDDKEEIFEKQLSETEEDEIMNKLDSVDLEKIFCCEDALLLPDHADVIIQFENKLYHCTHALQYTQSCNCLVCHLLALYPISAVLSN